MLDWSLEVLLIPYLSPENRTSVTKLHSRNFCLELCPIFLDYISCSIFKHPNVMITCLVLKYLGVLIKCLVLNHPCVMEFCLEYLQIISCLVMKLMMCHDCIGHGLLSKCLSWTSSSIHERSRKHMNSIPVMAINFIYVHVSQFVNMKFEHVLFDLFYFKLFIKPYVHQTWTCCTFA